MVRRFRPTDRILIDWDDDGYQHPFADVTENLKSYDIRYGADVNNNPQQIVLTKAQGTLLLDNSTFRYSYGSFTNDDIDEVSLAVPHRCKLVTDFYRTAEVSPGEFETRLVGEHTLWEGVAKLLPFVATSRKQEARFKLESASTQNAGLRDTFEYNDDFEQPFENFIESVNTFISSPSGNVADPSQFIIDSKTAPLLQVGFIRFNGNIYQFLENCQQYVGGWAYERANGNFGLRSFYAATGQDIQAKLNPSDFAYDSDTSRFQSQPDMVKNTHRLITTVVDADLSRSPTVLARARIDLNLQEGVGSGDRTTRVVDLDDTVIVEVQTKSNDWGSILSHIEATYREPENDEDVKPRFVAEFLQPEGVTTRIPGEPYRRDKINKVDIYRVAIVPVDEVVRRQRWTITFYGYEYEVLDSNAHDIEPDTGEVDEALHWSREHYGLREYCSPKWWPNNDSATYSIARDYLEVLSRPLQLITLNMPRWTAPKSEFSTMTPQQIHEQLSDIDTGHVVEVFSQSVDGITLLSKVLVLCVRYWHEVERVPYKSICGVALDPLQGISSVWQPFPSIPTKVGTATWQSRQGSIAGTGPRPTRTAFDDGFDDGFS